MLRRCMYCMVSKKHLLDIASKPHSALVKSLRRVFCAHVSSFVFLQLTQDYPNSKVSKNKDVTSFHCEFSRMKGVLSSCKKEARGILTRLEVWIEKKNKEKTSWEAGKSLGNSKQPWWVKSGIYRNLLDIKYVSHMRTEGLNVQVMYK